MELVALPSDPAPSSVPPSLDLSAAAIDAIPAHLAVLDETGVIVLTNAAWNEFATRNGLTCPRHGVGTSYLAACDAAQGEGAEMAHAFARDLRALLRGERDQIPPVSYACGAEGEERWFSVQACRLPQGGGAVVFHTDVTVLQRELQLVRRQALHDPLTGLPNRTLLHDRLQQALRQAQRTRTMVGLLLMDLDNFKTVNDTHGHDAGDELLVRVASRMKDRLRRGDTLARLGGDEFAAVLPNISGAAELRLVADALLKVATAPLVFRQATLQPRMSVGCALYPTAGLCAEHLLRCADRAMYRAKSHGGDRIEELAGLRLSA